MKTLCDISNEQVVDHFTTRSARYDMSSSWCTDFGMLTSIFEHLNPSTDAVLLDVACGTGLVSRHFQGKVGKVVGIDLTKAMFELGRDYVDCLIKGSAEILPFQNNVFDLAIERQGIQFMDAHKAVAEMTRTTRPGGKVCLIQLCAYGDEDKEEYFEILRLRNPARKNFFVREDLATLLETSGCKDVEVLTYISEEDVGRWADNGAITNDRQGAIRGIYQNASAAFSQYHSVRLHDDGLIVDRMLFGIAVGTVA